MIGVEIVILSLAFALFGVGLWQLRETRMRHPRSVVSDLDVRLKALELEWNNTYDKLNRLAGRLARERSNFPPDNGKVHTPSTDALDITSPNPETRQEVLKRWRSRARGY